MPCVAFPYLDDPADCSVWRYMNLEKLLSILIDRALFFAPTAVLAVNDKYEGQAMAGELAGLNSASIKEADDKYILPTINSSYFNCWHMNDSESDAMWKIYVTGAGGVAIRSTVARLKQCFNSLEGNVHLGRIRYVEDESDHLDHPVHRCMRKKPAFRHEQEIRLVYYDQQREHAGSAGLLIPIDVPVLVEGVVVSPRAESWFLPLVKKVVAKLGYEIEVVASEGSAPLPIDALT
jgi:hypothetical protein